MCSLLCSELQFYKKKHNLLEKKTSSVNQGPNLEVVELQNEYSVSKNQNHSSFIKGKPIFLTSIPISFFLFFVSYFNNHMKQVQFLEPENYPVNFSSIHIFYKATFKFRNKLRLQPLVGSPITLWGEITIIKLDMDIIDTTIRKLLIYCMKK